MEAGESIEIAEGMDRYTSMSFKNATKGKIVLCVFLCAAVLQIQIHIRKNYFYNTINRVYYAPVYVKI